MQFDSLVSTLNLIFVGLLSQLIDYLPQLLAAILTLLIGIIIGRWSKRIFIKALQNSYLARYLANNPNLTSFLKQAEVSLKPEEVIGEIVKWLIYAIIFITAINTLGLTTVSDFLMRLISFLPRVLSALIILIVGVLAAGVIESVVKGAVSRINVPTARILAKASSYTVLVFAAMVAISELGIAEEFIQILFTGMVAMLAIGLGLAFGLGSKDIVKRLLEQWYEDIRNERS